MYVVSSRFSEHLKALSTNYIHSTFATHLQNENQSYTNIEHNMEILHYLSKSRKLNTAEQFEKMCIRDRDLGPEQGKNCVFF